VFEFDHTGLWTTQDGEVRKLLLPNGRYIALVGRGEGPRRQGWYRVVGARIEYRGDNGETGTGLFEDGLLHSGTGALFYPEDFAEAAA
jgi:hypothetical protein